MKKSSVLQADLFDDNLDSSYEDEKQVITKRSYSGSPNVEFTNFNIGNYGNAFAESAKLAGRINALSVTAEEVKELYDERQKLLDKKFDESITKKEINRLEYVRWSLDRIEDAKSGQTLDALEDFVSKYENFLDEIKGLGKQLNEIAKRRR